MSDQGNLIKEQPIDAESKAGIEKASIHATPWWTRAGSKAAGAEVAMLNDAAFAATLSSMAYANREWVFDAGAGLVDPLGWEDSKGLASARGGMARARMVGLTCRAMEATELGIDPAASGSTLRGGVWRKGDLGAALVCLRTRADGSREIHLSIRGTELDKTPNPIPGFSKAKTFFEYVLGTFLSIDKHAKKFVPISEAIQRFANNPANRVSKVVVSGHSLGAAAAEKLALSMQGLDVPVVCFGFGSPGRGAGLRGPAYAAAEVLSAGVARLAIASAAGSQRLSLAATEAAANLAHWARRLSGARPTSLPMFSALAEAAGGKISLAFGSLSGHLENTAGDLLSPMFLNTLSVNGYFPGERRPDIVQFRHPSDLVPKLGSALYSSVGRVVSVGKAVEYVPMEAQTMMVEKVKAGMAHSSDRYAANVFASLRRQLKSLTGQDLDDRKQAYLESPDCDALRELDMATVEMGKRYVSVPEGKLAKKILEARRANAIALGARDRDDPTIGRLLSLPLPEPGPALSESRRTRAVEAFGAIQRLSQEFSPDAAAALSAFKKASKKMGWAPVEPKVGGPKI